MRVDFLPASIWVRTTRTALDPGDDGRIDNRDDVRSVLRAVHRAQRHVDEADISGDADGVHLC